MNINNDCTHIDDYARSDGSNMNKYVINRNHDDKCDSQICQQSKTTWFEENGIKCNKSIHHLNLHPHKDMYFHLWFQKISTLH